MKEIETPDVHIDTRLNKAVWAKGIRNVPYHIHIDVGGRGVMGGGDQCVLVQPGQTADMVQPVSNNPSEVRNYHRADDWLA
ncbi:hypothetical protein A6R68_23765 [Neotoma lepida]|uniref:60S ribosomal protein L31 n=1 Tax=Neotoma lepida TaxID=56216 RepID=A0A1A6HW57_NEOLE|nr:hypothetical protein A6R68_23765 [Neotoma lepida]